MLVTKGGKKLAEVIQKAIEDSVMTMAEYEEIMSVTSQDGVIDNHEKALLRELNDLIANRTVTLKRGL